MTGVPTQNSHIDHYRLELQPLAGVSQYRDALVHLGAGLVARLIDIDGVPIDRDSLLCTANHAWGRAADSFLQSFSTDRGIRIHYRNLDAIIPGTSGWEIRTPPLSPQAVDSPPPTAINSTPPLPTQVLPHRQHTTITAHTWLSHPILMRTLRNFLHKEWTHSAAIGCAPSGNLIAIPITDSASLRRAHTWLHHQWTEDHHDVFRQLWIISKRFPEPWEHPHQQVHDETVTQNGTRPPLNTPPCDYGDDMTPTPNAQWPAAIPGI